LSRMAEDTGPPPQRYREIEALLRKAGAKSSQDLAHAAIWRKRRAAPGPS
jgi:hypothetical protein